MKYEIHGADSKTGADRKIEVEAKNEKEALTIASIQGLLTTNIYPIHDVPFQKIESTQHEGIICPNPKCDYRGKPKKIVRCYNPLVAMLLVIFSVLPGLYLYIFLFNDLIQLGTLSPSAEGRELLALGAAIPVHAISALTISFPGFVYLIIKTGFISVCPKCGLQIRNN